MSLINPALLYGLGFAAVPIILHLLLKARPKPLPFPALRLIQPRRTYNVRRLRLRQIWLMLLRVAVIALIVLALSRPSLPAANYSLNPRETITLIVLAVLACGAYFGMVRHWRRAGMAAHVLRYQRTVLKAGVCAAGAVLFLLLVAWPYGRRVAGEMAAPERNVAEQLPVACVYVFDTSLSMGYRRENKTRLDVAKEIARQHRGSLPPYSRIAVADTATDSPIPFQADPAGAQDRIDKLQIRAVSVPLDRRLRTALKLHEEDYRHTLNTESRLPEADRKDRFVREIYVFTDLAKSAWRTDAESSLAGELRRLPTVGVYLIDIGVTQPFNVAISSLTLPKQTIVLGGDLSLEATIEATGTENRNQAVELYAYSESGELIKQGQETVTVGTGSARRVPFSITGLTSRFSQGEVRLLSSDPLSTDDVRYFTVEVRPPPNILVVAESRYRSLFWTEALAPEDLVRQGQANYRCKSLPINRLAETDLSGFDVVCLLSIAELAPETWRHLAQFVERGGGLAIFLGRFDLNTVSYNRPEAQAVMPARELVASLRFQPARFMDPTGRMHPLFQGFSDPRYLAELASVPIERYWKVKPADGATVIAPYTDADRSPALLERARGKGRVVLLTTAVSSTDWNAFPQSWSFVVFADLLMQHLSGRGDNVFNYIAGETVIVRLDGSQPDDGYLLRKPLLQQRPGRIPPNGPYVTIDDADQLGHYEIVPEKRGGSFRAGFSVNPSPGESDFTRLTKAQMDALFGEDRYSVARDIEGLVKNVRVGRVGREVFPILLSLMLLIFCAEHVVANRFYRSESLTELVSFNHGKAAPTSPGRDGGILQNAEAPLRPTPRSPA